MWCSSLREVLPRSITLDLVCARHRPGPAHRPGYRRGPRRTGLGGKQGRRRYDDPVLPAARLGHGGHPVTIDPGGPRILIVDDDPRLLRLLGRGLAAPPFPCSPSARKPPCWGASTPELTITSRSPSAPRSCWPAAPWR